MKNMLAKVGEAGIASVSELEEIWLGFEVMDGAVPVMCSSTWLVLVIPDEVPFM
jgi:hypothetical protein